MELLNKEKLRGMKHEDSMALAQSLKVDDTNVECCDEFYERIMVTHRKILGIAHNPFNKYAEIQGNARAKSDSLVEILNTLHTTLSQIPTWPMSEVLRKEGILKQQDILLELKSRIKALEDRNPHIVIAGETNGGKSSCLNTLLGKKILPTDVWHCTFAACKIMYAKTYSIETLTYNDKKETFVFTGPEDAHKKLLEVVAQRDPREREKMSVYKEITLKLPSPILKSGVTLIDMPGIAETAAMDDVVMKYIRSTRASAFIYVIKSDACGGVQEDMLLSFIRAIQEVYKTDTVEGAIDPQAAFFICNRWDQIEEEDKVAKNILTRLDKVWPEFKKEQVFFFSSKKAQQHLDIDPEFVTDELNNLVSVLRNHFDRAIHNSIHDQYSWTKQCVQSISRQLTSIINNCINFGGELRQRFKSVTKKQAILKAASTKYAKKLQESLKDFEKRLKKDIRQALSKIQPSDIGDYNELLALCSAENFLQSRGNRDNVDEWVVSSISHYCDDTIQRSGIMKDVERKIQEHFGLLEEQVKEIAEIVKGTPEKRTVPDTKPSKRRRSSSNTVSMVLIGVINLINKTEESLMDPTLLDQTRIHFMEQKTKSSRLTKARQIFSTGRRLSGSINNKEPRAYLDQCIQTNAAMMRGNETTIEGFVAGYLHLIQMYIDSAAECIPHFTDVNEKQMENIRDHHKVYHDDKLTMKSLMDALEPCRQQLSGYGSLYMEDVQANSLEYNMEGPCKNVSLNRKKMSIPSQHMDSGFLGSGSSGNEQQIPSTIRKDKHLQIQFFPRTIQNWNSLPPDIVNIKDPRLFERTIQEHFGLLEEQVKEIAEIVKGTPEKRTVPDTKPSKRRRSSSNTVSMVLIGVINLINKTEESLMDPTLLDQTRIHFMEQKTKSSRLTKARQIFSTGRRLSGSINNKEPRAYLDQCIQTNAAMMRGNETTIEGFVAGYLHLIQMYIDSAAECIPHFTDVNEKQMENIRDHHKVYHDDKLTMKSLMDALEPCRQQLSGYGSLYMEDVQANSLEYNMEGPCKNVSLNRKKMSIPSQHMDSGFLGSGSSGNEVRGFWVHYRNATILIDDQPVNMTVKTYTCDVDKGLQLSEIASLRYLIHPNLAPFFGMTRCASTDSYKRDGDGVNDVEKMSAFIFRGDMVSARVSMEDHRLALKEFLFGLLSGLEFIHGEKLVHLELNLDTVMTNSETGVVQLCQQCTPRKAQLPNDLSIPTKACVCLSPSVLRGNIYGVIDDYYALALMVWKLLVPHKPPFSQQKAWPLGRFIEEVNPSQMLEPELEQLPVPDAVKLVLRWCLTQSTGTSCGVITMDEIIQIISQFVE